jgi:hypothetical protein
MSLDALSILEGTTPSFTGGSALNFASKGLVGSSLTLYDEGAVDYVNRKDLVLSVKNPKINAGSPNGYTQARSEVLWKFPLVLDNGSSTVNTARLTIATDVETTDAERLEMRQQVAQALLNSDMVEFFDNQALV